MIFSANASSGGAGQSGRRLIPLATVLCLLAATAWAGTPGNREAAPPTRVRPAEVLQAGYGGGRPLVAPREAAPSALPPPAVRAPVSIPPLPASVSPPAPLVAAAPRAAAVPVANSFSAYASRPTPPAPAAPLPPVADPATTPSREDAAGHRRWLRNPVRFDVRHYPLPLLLRDFCGRQGVACQVSENLDGVVTGRFAFRDPGRFIDLLATAQNMNWYFDGGIVHFFGEGEVATRLYSLDGKREEALRRALIDLGLYDPRFAWRVADNGGTLLVQGPEIYLDRVGGLLERQKEAASAESKERELSVFRLRHAWASDQTFDMGSGSTTVPGVASLLRQIMSETAAGPAAGAPPAPGEPQFLRGKGVVGRRENPERPAAPDAAAAAAPFIQADARLNAVMVWDYRENMPRYQAIIDSLDQPLTLVEIRAAIVDVEADRLRDLGITWEYKGQGGRWHNNLGSNVGEGDGRVTYDSISGDGFQYATIYTRGLDQFMARVSALEKDGNANVLSRPSVLTQDNIQATLEHTETFYVRLTGEREVDLADITTGLTLRVTPHVIQADDGNCGVQLAVYIANGTNSYDDSAKVDDLPRVRQSTISTQAVVYEGESLVIGGYYNELRQSSISGVPVLKNIPMLGALFRTRNTSNTKSERLFVLSPRVIQPGENYMRPGSEAERAFDASPGRNYLDGPAFDDSTPKPNKRLLWNNPQPDGKLDYTW